MANGKLVVIEGACDGMGKSTQCSLLAERLVKNGETLVQHHFPTYDTYQGRPVEKYLSGDYGNAEELSPYFINSLYAMDRSITWHAELKKLYEQGNFLLFDRYTTSSIIYQSAVIPDLDERKRFIEFIIDYEYNKLGIKEPDKVIFLHAPFEIVRKMMSARKENGGIANDIYERNLDLMNRIHENSMFVADYLSWDMVRCDDGKAMRSKEDIHKDVYRLVRRSE